MYIAIDGGGTKTEYLLLDENFYVAERCFGQCVNHDFLTGGWEETRAQLQRGISTVLEKRKLQIGHVRDIAAGISGIDTRDDQKKIETCLKEMGVQRFAVCNDGFLSVMAECPGGWGIAYNCGTGVCCAAINEKHGRMRTAGLDEWSGDAGGGNWIVQQMFCQIYKDVVYWKEETSLVKVYKKVFALQTKEEVIDFVSKLKQPLKYPKLQQQMIRILFDQLQEGDEEAAFIVNEMLHCAYHNVHAVVKELEFEHREIPLILTGSIHTKAANPEYLRRLGEILQRAADHRLKIRMAEKSPVYGAVQWLKERNTE